MRGNITRRGKTSWRLKFDLGRDPATGQRRIRFTTVRGKRQDAERELTRLLGAAHEGGLVDPSKLTIADYVRSWLDGADGISPKTLERYRQLAEQQIIPHLGAILLQKLRPAHVHDWHATLVRSGGKGGRALSARTVGHAHRVMHRALARAAALELVSRNVVSAVKPPRVEAREIEILAGEQMGDVLAKLDGHALHPIVAVALGTGARRGEILALRWVDVDLDSAALRIERSIEETGAGLRFKEPKTRHGRRSISLPQSAIDALRAHRRRQLELRLGLGMGRPGPDALVFATQEGEPLSPDNLSRDWRRAVTTRGLPRVMFHALRHSHASALIAAGLDVLSISRRLGHGSPTVTLTVYGHLFANKDGAAAAAIEAAMRTGAEP
jgi:integrase